MAQRSDVRALDDLLKQAAQLPDSDPQVRDFAEQARQLAIDKHDPHREAQALQFLGQHASANGHHEEAILLFKEGWKNIRDNDPPSNSRALKSDITRGLVRSLSALHQEDARNAFLDEAQETAYASNDSLFLADVLNIRGAYAFQSGHYYTAVEYYREAEEVYRTHHDEPALSKVLFNLGLLYKRKGKYDESLPSLIEASELFAKNDQRQQEAQCLNTIGAVYRAWGDPVKATSYHTEALHLFRSLDDSLQVAVALNSLGLALHNLQLPDSALTQLKEALKIKRKLLATQAISATLHNIGFVFMEVNTDSALHYLGKAEELKKELNDRFGLALLYNDFARVRLRLKEPRQAQLHLQQAIRIAHEVEALQTLLESLELSKALAMQANDLSLALRYSEQHDSLNQAIFQVEARKEAEQLEARFQNHKKQEELIVKNSLLELRNEELSRERNFRYFIGILSIVLLVVAATIIILLRQRQQNLQLEAERQAAEAELEGGEQERQRIATVLHDDVAGVLSAANAILKQLASSQPQLPVLSTLQKHISAAYRSTRLTSHQLAPYEHFGRNLVEGLEEFFLGLNEASDIRIDFVAPPQEVLTALPDSLQLLTYRSLQELTKNAINHAQANHIEARFTVEKSELAIHIKDNGKGMVKGAGKGLGQASLQRRIRLHDGRMNIRSAAGQGTDIHIHIPLP